VNGEDIKDPATRTAKVKAVLGADTLPDGYHPMVGLSIPLHMGIWFAPDPHPQAPAATADLQGTPADAEALTAFLAHFHLCREAP
jgi:hypothetical protein